MYVCYVAPRFLYDVAPRAQRRSRARAPLRRRRRLPLAAAAAFKDCEKGKIT
jgi:hypothetical protein